MSVTLQIIDGQLEGLPTPSHMDTGEHDTAENDSILWIVEGILVYYRSDKIRDGLRSTVIQFYSIKCYAVQET